MLNEFLLFQELEGLWCVFDNRASCSLTTDTSLWRDYSSLTLQTNLCSVASILHIIHVVVNCSSY
jgi:hypothetical protein